MKIKELLEHYDGYDLCGLTFDVYVWGGDDEGYRFIESSTFAEVKNGNPIGECEIECWRIESLPKLNITIDRIDYHMRKLKSLLKPLEEAGKREMELERMACESISAMGLTSWDLINAHEWMYCLGRTHCNADEAEEAIKKILNKQKGEEK